MKKSDYKKLKAWLEKRFGLSSECEIEYEGEKIIGLMSGNDECFDLDEFYQYFLTNDGLYKSYYKIPNGETDLGNIDYVHPYNMEVEDVDYLINYVINKEV